MFHGPFEIIPYIRIKGEAFQMKWALEQNAHLLVTTDHLRLASLAASETCFVCTECKTPVIIGRKKIGEAAHHYYFAHRSVKKTDASIKETTHKCPLHITKGPYFYGLLAQPTNSIEKDRVSEILESKDVRSFNIHMLQKLYLKATNEALSAAACEKMYSKAVETYASCAVLSAHPHLLPYMKIASYDSLARKGYGGNYAVRFRQGGSQYLLYQDHAGCLHQAAVPAHLQLMQAVHKAWRPLVSAGDIKIDISMEESPSIQSGMAFSLSKQGSEAFPIKLSPAMRQLPLPSLTFPHLQN